tara:strand:+ start:1315 stop:1719 length:405 start_codon:yes stop_codon:yes gene_type:complete
MDKKDYKFGSDNETKILEEINKYFDTTLIQTSKWCSWDYENKDYLMELKTRRCNHNSYPTTMIGMNKIDKLLKREEKKVLLFNFKDGLYFFTLDDDTIKECEINQNGGRSDRGTNEYKNNGYCYIPFRLLTKIG